MEKRNWGEMNAGKRDIMGEILEEVRLWLQLEPFSFPPAYPGWQLDIKNVHSVQALLVMLLDFLRQAEMSEDQLVAELLNESIQSEVSSQRFLWWLMSTKSLMDGMTDAILSQSLCELLGNYSRARKELVGMVEDRLRMIQTWTAAFLNGEAFYILEQIHKNLASVRSKFQEWTACAQFRRFSSVHLPKPSRPIPMEAINRKMDDLIKKVSSPPLLFFSPPPHYIQPDPKCTKRCFLQTNFLHFASKCLPIEKSRSISESHNNVDHLCSEMSKMEVTTTSSPLSFPEWQDQSPEMLTWDDNLNNYLSQQQQQSPVAMDEASIGLDQQQDGVGGSVTESGSPDSVYSSSFKSVSSASDFHSLGDSAAARMNDFCEVGENNNFCWTPGNLTDSDCFLSNVYRLACLSEKSI